MIARRVATALAGCALGFGVVVVVTADAEPEFPPQYEPPLSKQCQAVMEDPEGLSDWLADRNGISRQKARQTVADAITNVCAEPIE